MYARLGRVCSNKDGSSVLDVLGVRSGVLDLQNQVLRCVLVAEAHGLLHRCALDDDGEGDRLSHDRYSSESEGLRADFGLNLGEDGGGHVDGEEDDLGVDTVLGLREKVGGDEGGVAVLVGDDLWEGL